MGCREDKEDCEEGEKEEGVRKKRERKDGRK